MKKLLIANWKMNPPAVNEAVRLAHGEDFSGVVVAVPFVFLESVKKVLKRAGLGAQNVFLEEPRAATGEISPAMLKKIGVRYVILGHSERRRLAGETDEMINKKVRAALKAGLRVVLCVGEPTRVTRDKKQGLKRAKSYVKKQLEKDLRGISLSLVAGRLSLIVAYEPVWAISAVSGGVSDTPEAAAEMISFIKKTLYPKSYTLNPKVLYGGSVTAKNAAGFLRRPEIDGALVGGASLKAGEFKKIWMALN